MDRRTSVVWLGMCTISTDVASHYQHSHKLASVIHTLGFQCSGPRIPLPTMIPWFLAKLQLWTCWNQTAEHHRQIGWPRWAKKYATCMESIGEQQYQHVTTIKRIIHNKSIRITKKLSTTFTTTRFSMTHLLNSSTTKWFLLPMIVLWSLLQLRLVPATHQLRRRSPVPEVESASLHKSFTNPNSSNDFCEICYSSLMWNYVKLININMTHMTLSTVFKQQLVSHVVRSMPHSSQQIFPWLSVILRYPRHPCPSSSHRFLDHQMMASFWSFLLSAWVSRVSPGPPWPKMFAPAAYDQYRFMHFRTEILTPSMTSRP